VRISAKENTMNRKWLPWVLVVVLVLVITCVCCVVAGGWYFVYGPGVEAEEQVFEQVYPTPIPQEVPETEVLPEVDMGEVEVPEVTVPEEGELELLPMEEGAPGLIDDTSCHGKLWTFYLKTDSEGNILKEEMYLIEVQSGSGRGEANHMDWWQIGTLSTSVIEKTLRPEESSEYVVGLGSLFVFLPDRDDCGWLLEMEDGLDGIAREIILYASSRMDQGHSGLTFDNRNGEMVLISNAGNLPQSEVDRYRQLYLDAHWSIGTALRVVSRLARLIPLWYYNHGGVIQPNLQCPISVKFLLSFFLARQLSSEETLRAAPYGAILTVPLKKLSSTLKPGGPSLYGISTIKETGWKDHARKLQSNKQNSLPFVGILGIPEEFFLPHIFKKKYNSLYADVLRSQTLVI